MKDRALSELMHVVLDGEATEAETRELECRLAADGRARAEFDDLKRLFRALGAVPDEHPPEGLVAAVTAALPGRGDARSVPRQPFSSPRVFGHASSWHGGDPSVDPATDNSASAAPTRSLFMSQQSSRTFGNRKVWVGIGVAAAVVVVAQYGFDFPLGQDVTGTIVPAQRYRAAPNGSEQVKLGAPSATPQTSATPAIAPVAQGSDRSAVERSAAERAAADLAVNRNAADMASKRSSADAVSADMAAKRSAPDQTAADRMSADRMSADRMVADRMAADRIAADRVAADRSTANRAVADRSVADRIAADRAAADRAAAERATLDRAAADRVGPNRQQ